jgi:hypothetical protein
MSAQMLHNDEVEDASKIFALTDKLTESGA